MLGLAQVLCVKSLIWLQVNRRSADPSITEAAEKADDMADRLDSLEAQVLTHLTD